MLPTTNLSSRITTPPFGLRASKCPHMHNNKPNRVARRRPQRTVAYVGEPKVAVLMGSKNDMPLMLGAVEALQHFDIDTEVRVLSAHRNPNEVQRFVTNARIDGYVAIIAGAGKAAHLAGAVAANTTLPVVGVPLSGSLMGMDSLLSTSQMPKGVPVATVAIDGSYNAGLLVAQMLAINDIEMAKKLADLREQTSK